MNALRLRLQALGVAAKMWYAGHSPREQRIILGVLTFAGLCLVYLWGWIPMRDYQQSVADEIVEGQEQLKRSVRIVRSADSLRAERESLEKKLTQARQRLLPGRGATLGAAALQERANALAAEKGIAVQSTQVMKDEALDPYRKVAIKLVLSGELKPFAELVSALEFGQQLAVPNVEVNRRGVAPGAKGPRTLSATLEVAGFVLAEDAKVDEAPAAGEAGAEPAPTGDGTAPASPPGGPGAATGAPTPTLPGAPAAATGALHPRSREHPRRRSGAPATAPTGAPAAQPAGPAGSAAPTGAPGHAAPAAVPPGKDATTTTTAPRARAKTTTTTRPVPTLPPIVPRKPPQPAPAAPAEEAD